MEKNASATYGRALASDRSLMFKGLLINAARRAFALLSAAALLCSVSACAEVVPTDSCSHTPPPMQTDSKQEAALELMAVSEPPPETEPETEPPRTEPAPPPEPVQQEEHENSVTYSEPEPTYINGILIVNKTYALPSSYGGGADPTALAAVNEMIAAAAEEGLNLFIISGYRSYDKQANIYRNYVARDSQAAADRYSARPGHSEHQTGLAFDMNSIEQSFAETPEGIWLAENCSRFGFIIRYTKENEPITGYMYEPWHVRYLGVDIAQQVEASGLCLEAYLGITSQYSE